MSKFRVLGFEFRVLGWVGLLVLLLLVACGAAADASNDMVLSVPVIEAKPAPTATPPAPAQHFLLAVGESATLLCGGTPKVEGTPAGQISLKVNGTDSLEFGCSEWEGGPGAAATGGDVDQHWQLEHEQVGYALCGGEALDGIPAGQWEMKVNGVDSVELACRAWEGGGDG